MSITVRPICTAAILVIAAASAATPQSRIPRPSQSFAVRFAVDGDTLDVAGVGRVRLLGIDAPERGAGFDTPAPFAREARDRLASLAVRRYVRLEIDGDSRDAYGRTLAYVIRADGVHLNAEMLRAGLARVSARTPLRRLGELQRAEDAAQQARRGIWGERPSIPPRTLQVPVLR